MLSEFENSGVKVRGGRNMSHCVLQGASNLLCFAKKKNLTFQYWVLLFVCPFLLQLEGVKQKGGGE